MAQVFEKLLEMSLTAAIVIVVVMAIRLLLRKAPRKYSYALWSVAAFRLVCPVSFEAVFSLFTFANRLEEAQIQQTVTTPLPNPDYTLSTPPGMVSDPIDIDPEYVFTYPVTTPVVETPAAPTVNWIEVAAIVWLVGLAALLIYGIVSYLRLRRRMSTAILLEGNVWQSDRVQSPFILGFVRPKIYLPFGLGEDQQRYVLAHERYHIKRFDHIVRPLSFLILAVHWFNPFVWLAYYLMSRDMEMSCDEKVLSDGESIKAYSTTLLSFAANRRFPSPSPLAFGESGVKGRIKNALNWKKPRTWVTIIAIIVCIVVIVVCAANPASHPRDWTKDLTMEDVDWAELRFYTEEWNYRSLSDDEVEELVGLLNNLRRSDMKQPSPRSAWAFPTERMVTICCDGVEYKLNLGPSPMTLICNDENIAWGNDDPWFVGNEELKQFIRDLPVGELPTEPSDIYYQSIECLYMTPLSSALAKADSGYYYLLRADELRLVSKSTGALTLYAADGGWQELSDDFLHKMEWGTTLGDTDLWDTLETRRPMIRFYGDDYKLLLNFGNELWVGSYHYDQNGYISLWDLYRLEKLDGEPILPVEELGTWYADLTHDGVDEAITLQRNNSEVPYGYAITVTTSYGKVLWKGNASDWRGGNNGIYLYERDGKHYILEWWPSGQQGWYNFSYRVFSLNGTEEPDILAENALQYDFGAYENRTDILTVDLEELRAFEAEVNTLLNNAIPLLVIHDGKTILGDPSNPVTDQWTSPADDWEEQRQAALAQQGDREARTLAVWPLNDLTLTVLEGDYDIYTIDVYHGDYYYWSTSFDRLADDLMYYRYEENGVQYLMELTGSGGQGIGMWSYRIFSIGPESITVLRENSLYYEAMSVETVLAVDVEAIRAFEAEVNALLEHAELIAGIESNRFLYNAKPGTEYIHHWSAGVIETIEESQSYWRGMEKKLNKAVTEQIYRYYAENLRWYSIRGFGQFVMLDSYMDKQGATAWVVASFIEIDGDGNWMGEFSNIPMMFTFDMVDDQYVLTEAWAEEKGLNFDAQDELKHRFPPAAAQAVIDGTYTDQLRQSLLADWELPYHDLTMAVPDGVLDYALSYILSTHPEAQDIQINTLEEISTGAVGTTSGHLMYRLVYSVKLEDRWQLFKDVYLVLHADWSSSSDYWYACGTVTQEEIDTIYSTEAMLQQYGDPYLAAAAELYRQWDENR